MGDEDYNKSGYTSYDNWTFGMSQLFSSVGPQMHDEFEFAYLNEVFSCYKHVYYGCCEPLHNKMEMIKKYKNVRKISVSPWADKRTAAEQMGAKYIYSNKPNPAFLAMPDFDEELIVKDLRETKKICFENSVPLEFILKDVSTVKYGLNRLVKWNEIAKRVAEE